MEKHGLILVNEISTRTSLSVNSRNLTYNGLVDFRNGNSSTHINEKADDGLVLLFQPLYDNYSQPIAVFVSKGPVHGVTLAQLILQGYLDKKMIKALRI